MDNDLENPQDGPSQQSVPASSARHFPPFSSLRAFDAVARTGSIRKAGRAITRDHAVVSRHVRALELWLGTALVIRTPSGIELTPAGATYHQTIAQAIDLIANATRSLTAPVTAYRLQIHCMPALALHWLGPRVVDFEALYPGALLALRPTDQPTDLGSGEGDIDIRLETNFTAPPTRATGLKRLRLITLPIIAAASPSYLSTHPELKALQDLPKVVLLHEDDTHVWSAWLQANGIDAQSSLPGPVLWQGHLTLDAAKHGRGIALTNTLVAAKELKRGELIDLNAEFASPSLAVASYVMTTRESEWHTGTIGSFRDWLVSEFATMDNLQAYQSPGA